MGIKHLNKYLLRNCRNSVKNIYFSELKNKKISIDISIYLYQFERNGNLIDGINSMINIFKIHNIIPVFIFDGKPPDEKKNILQERRKQKNKNREKIEQLTIMMESNPSQDKNIILSTIERLRQQCISITREKIEQVKNIIRLNGFTYYDAPQEADELCSILATRGQVWACMSEDMDMFVYGCPRIIRYFNIRKPTVKLYIFNTILSELNISSNNFKQICILSGTDYNSQNNKYNLSYSINLFNQYQNEEIEQIYKPFGFIEWIIININPELNYELLNKIYYMFDLSDKLMQFKNILIMNSHK